MTASGPTAAAAGVDISTYMIAAAVQQMIRDDQAAASFTTIDADSLFENPFVPSLWELFP